MVRRVSPYSPCAVCCTRKLRSLSSGALQTHPLHPGSTGHPGASIALALGEAPDDGVVDQIVDGTNLMHAETKHGLGFRAGGEPLSRGRQNSGFDAALTAFQRAR